MNEKIVIIGNGFDLRHFLPTKYGHLMTILREIEEFNFDNKSEIFFEDIFGGRFKENDNWFYNNINEYYDTEKIHFQVDQLKSIQERLNKNNWFQYLKSVEDNKIETWIDFETEIVRVLKLITNYFEQTSLKVFKYPSYGDFKDGEYYYFPTYESEYFISNSLQSFVLSFFNLFQKDDERLLMLVNQNYILAMDDKIQYYKEKIFYDDIYSSLDDFIGIFNDYIVCIVNHFFDNFKETKKENFISKDSKFLFDKVSKIYSFNYTDSYSKLYKYIDDQKEFTRSLIRNGNFKGVDFLHGKAIENWKNVDDLKIVLGVDDIEKNLKNHKLFQFTKYFQKLHKETDYLFLDSIVNSIKSGLHNFRFDFYFWGHSLDVSDQEYIKDVFYVSSETPSRIKIFFHSVSGKADQLKNLLNIIEKDIIEKMMKTDRLVFIESTAENLFKEL